MKAIRTRYHGATNTRSSRIKADDMAGNSFTVVICDGLRSEEAHAEAAKGLCAKMGWHGDLVSGGFPNGDMVWTFAQSFRVSCPRK